MRTAPHNIICWVAVLSLFFVLTFGSTTYYASGGKVGEGNSCLSASEPCSGILAALSLAQDGDQIVLLEETFSGSLNVPFTITQANLTLKAEGELNKTVISCGQQYPFCVNIGLTGITTIDGITFSGYQSLSPEEILEHQEGPPDSPFQGMIRVHSKIPQTISHSTKNVLVFENCSFQQNSLSETQTTEDNFNFDSTSLVFIDKLIPSASVQILDSEFLSNTVSLINAYYSNVLLERTTFSLNVASILTATTHSYFGGSNVTISRIIFFPIEFSIIISILIN